MNERIKAIIDGVIEIEGGYVDHPNDPGGATKYGITEAVARANGYRGHMRELPRSTAFQIYYVQYVVGPNFDDVLAIDPAVGEELVDTGVNTGQDRAALWFQKSLNSLNDRQRDYRDITEDGDVGPKTLEAFRAFKRRRGRDATHIMLAALDIHQGHHYLTLADDNSKFESFANGWLRHRIRNVAA